MNLREKSFLVVLLLALGYFIYMLGTGVSLFTTYNKDSKNTAEIIMDDCELTTLFVVTVDERYGGRIYDCKE